MFKASLLMLWALYFIPLAMVMDGKSVASQLFLFCMIIGAFVVWLFFHLKKRQLGRNLTPSNFEKMLSAPKKFVALSAIAYAMLRSPEIVNGLSALATGTLAQEMLAAAVDRYTGNSTVSLRYHLGTMVLFVFFTFWGSRIGSNDGRKFFGFCFCFAIFAGFIESLQLARAGLLLALLCFFVELIIRKNESLQKTPFQKYLYIALPLTFIGFGIFFFSAYFRVYGSEDALRIVLDKFSLYTIASYDLFFLWLDTEGPETLGGGRQTFAFLWKILGEDFPQGSYAPMLSEYGYGNVYLNLRGLLEDFGAVGSVAFYLSGLFCVGFCTYSQMTVIKFFVLRIALAIIFFPIISPFYFTTFAAAFFSSGGALVLWSSIARVHGRENRMNDKFYLDHGSI